MAKATKAPTPDISAQLAEARLAALREACAAICGLCRAGRPVDMSTGMHGRLLAQPCAAIEIHSLIRRAGS